MLPNDEQREWERLLAEACNVPPPSEAFVEDLHSQILRQMDRAPQVARPVSKPFLIRRMLMNPRIAVTVVIVLAMVGLLAWFGGNDIGSQIAFAEIQERLRETKSISFTQTQTLHVEGRPAKTSHCTTILAGSLMRIDSANGDYTVIDFKHGKELMVSSKQKKAILWDGLAGRFPVFYDKFRNISQDAVKRLDEREIDGKKTIGFLVQLDVPNMGDRKVEMTVWVDPATRLPVRMERTGKGEGVVLDDIVFDGEVDESLLSLTPPVGFAVETRKLGVELQPVPDDKDLAAPQVLPKVGLGPGKFGMSTDELLELLGKPDKILSEGTTLCYLSRGYTLIVGPSRGRQ